VSLPFRASAMRCAWSCAILFIAGVAQAQDKPPGYAIASAHPLATDAGIEILREGGNAFDASVAVSAALAVVEPYSSGIGGGGFWLLHRAADGYETMVDGRETAPSGASATMYQDKNGHAIASLSRDGAIAGGIPGEPAALAWIAERYGKLGLARDLAPAIRLARDGFAIDPHFSKFIGEEAKRLSPAARAVFMPGGAAPPAGTVIAQPDLAATLQALADRGRAGFYTGEVAQKLVAGVQADHGLWTAADLARYRVVERAPMSFYFRDYRIVSAPPPSAGGIGLAEILQQLEVLGWTGDDGLRSDQQVIEAMRRAYRDRAAWLGDPDFVYIPTYRLLSRTYAIGLASSITPLRATPSSALPSPDAVRRDAQEGRETSHLSIIDADGNRVSATVTVNLRFGSGYMAPGTGVLVNDEMDDFAASVSDSNAYGLTGSHTNLIAPGKRPLSSMAPSFVEGPNGVMVIGTPGGSRIVTMVLLGILHFVHGASTQDIVVAPRYHQQYLPDVVEYEPAAFDVGQQVQLQAMGYTLKPVANGYGNLQAVVWRWPEGRLEGAADPRGVGSATVIETTPVIRQVSRQ
jgi:gamma-glutamyltranspeptidase/glutathione hydrolase